MRRPWSMIFPLRGHSLQAVLVAASLTVASCSSSGGAIGTGGRAGGVGGSAMQCAGGAGGGSGEPALEQIDASGGIPADGFRHAMAVVRCGFLNRCSNLAPYVVNQCVDALTANVPWTYQVCSGTAASASCATVNTRYAQPTDALLRGVAAGTVAYDPQAAARCLAALSAQVCLAPYLTENLPACAGVFTCPPGGSGAGGSGGVGAGGMNAAGGAGGMNAAGGAGGAAGASGVDSCAALLDPTPPVDTCVTDADCTGVTAAGEGPYCVGGVCAASRCGLFDPACAAFATVGENCSFDAPGLASLTSSTLPGTCAPSLACQGAVSGLHGGACVVPQDVGAPCTADAGCDRGLVCLCGLCQLPPVTGPCAGSGQCRIGAAYCDFQTLTCQPVRPAGAGCNDAFNACAPGLLCQSGTCVIPQP